MPALLLSFYISYALYSVFPYGAYLPASTPFIALASDVGVFLAFSLLAYLILRNLISTSFISISYAGVIILAVLAVGFLIALGYQVFDLQSLYALPASIAPAFLAKEYFFWWFIAPLVGLFFLAR